MQFISLVLSLVLLAQFTILRLPATAGPITYNPQASNSQATVEGKVEVSKVGNLMMKDAYAFMHGNQVDIVGKTRGSNNSEGVLSGSVIAPKVHTSGGTATLTGTAFFASGTAMGVISNPAITETVDTVGGGSVTGKIVSVSTGGITVLLSSGTERVIAMADVSAIKSPRAYTFKLIGHSASAVDPLKTFSVDAQTMAFSPTTTAATATTATSATSATKVRGSDRHMSRRTKLVLFIAALLVIATAIAVPIAVAVPHHGTSSAHTNVLEQLALYNFAKQRQAAAAAGSMGKSTSGVSGFAHMGGCI